MRNPVKRTGLRNERLGGTAGRMRLLVPGFAKLISDPWRDRYSVPETQALYKLCRGSHHP